MYGIEKKIRYWFYFRQGLGKQGSDLIQILKNIIGVYSVHPFTPLSLFSRIKTFNEHKFHDLDMQKLAFRIPAMRLSVYFIPLESSPRIFSAIIPPASDAMWKKRYSQKGRNIPDEKYRVWKDRVLQISSKPMTIKDLKKVSDIPDKMLKLILNRMAFEGILLRIGAGSLRSNIISYVSTQAWAKISLFHRDSQKDLVWLAGEYLRAFGPARIKDFQWWAGINLGKAQTAIEQLHTIDLGNDYLLLSRGFEEFESFKTELTNSIDILPQWDCYIMGYSPDGRDRFVSSDMQYKVYGSVGVTGGNALGTVLVNGLTQGTWSHRFEATTMKINLDMFEKLTMQLEKNIKIQFNEIAALFKVKRLIFEKN